MYLNRITLIGFIGNDAERKAANATNIAIFSLATKTSWKNDAGARELRTEWHRYVYKGFDPGLVRFYGREVWVKMTRWVRTHPVKVR